MVRQSGEVSSLIGSMKELVSALMKLQEMKLSSSDKKKQKQ